MDQMSPFSQLLEPVDQTSGNPGRSSFIHDFTENPAGIWVVKRVLIEKLSASEAPAFPTPGWENYVVGAVNPGVSLPTSYVVEGFLIDEISIGRPVRVLRVVRNGINAPGHFTTSPVVSFHGSTFRTSNSVYRYTVLSDAQDQPDGA